MARVVFFSLDFGFLQLKPGLGATPPSNNPNRTRRWREPIKRLTLMPQ